MEPSYQKPSAVTPFGQLTPDIKGAGEGVIDHLLILHGKTHHTDGSQRPAADIVDLHRLGSQQPEHLPEKLAVHIFQPFLLQFRAQNLNGLDKADSYDASFRP